ncbi:MAG: hypothetical protein QM729_05990 [Solirubrobacterales bacterium]
MRAEICFSVSPGLEPSHRADGVLRAQGGDAEDVDLARGLDHPRTFEGGLGVDPPCVGKRTLQRRHEGGRERGVEADLRLRQSEVAECLAQQGGAATEDIVPEREGADVLDPAVLAEILRVIGRHHEDLDPVGGGHRDLQVVPSARVRTSGVGDVGAGEGDRRVEARFAEDLGKAP